MQQSRLKNLHKFYIIGLNVAQKDTKLLTVI